MDFLYFALNFPFTIMIKEFIQKRGLNYRKYFLYEDKIIVELKIISQVNKYEIKLDQIGFDMQYQADNTMPGKIALVVCIAIFLSVVVDQIIYHNIQTNILVVNLFCWGGLALLSYFKQHKDDVYLTGGRKNLVFYRNIPNEASVVDFIQIVISTSKKYLRNKYTEFDSYTVEGEFMNRLLWLKQRER
jgi:hypothetical protein